jgi:hypothetical protein
MAPRSKARSVLLGLGIGLGVAVAATAIAFAIVAVPMFLLVSSGGDSGIDRGMVRTGLFGIAVPIGVLAGSAVGIAVGMWYSRGGRLPTGRSPADG